HFQRHIRRMRRAALSRRDALLAGWPDDIPGCAAMPKVVAGLVGVEMSPLSGYWLPDFDEPVDNRAGLVLGFAAVPEPAIADALNRLRTVWSE
ncbi:GntR family transcriptional regulator, partial [Pseudomonas syringae pv. actinidiae ICMP 19079]